MQLVRTRLVELGLITGLLSTFSPIFHIQIVQAQSADTPIGSVNGKYSDLIQVVNCPNDRASYGEFRDWGYWGGPSWCGQSTQPGYWVWVNPNWYIWRKVGIARPENPVPAPVTKPTKLQEARNIARTLREEYSGWKNGLDACPCTSAAAAANPRFTDATHRYTKKYHPGAVSEYRSTANSVRPYTSSTRPDAPTLMPGQQCTYDANGNLITGGAGAGTPDAYAPERTFYGQGLLSNNSHTFWDVNPFDADGMTWQEYQQTWTPNNGNSCSVNVVSTNQERNTNTTGRETVAGVCRQLVSGDRWYPSWRSCCDLEGGRSRWTNSNGQASDWNGSCAYWGIR